MKRFTVSLAVTMAVIGLSLTGCSSTGLPLTGGSSDSQCPLSNTTVKLSVGASDNGTVDFNDWTTGEPPLSNKRNCIYDYQFDSGHVGANRVMIWWATDPSLLGLGGEGSAVDGLKAGTVGADRSTTGLLDYLISWEQDGYYWLVEANVGSSQLRV